RDASWKCREPGSMARFRVSSSIVSSVWRRRECTRSTPPNAAPLADPARRLLLASRSQGKMREIRALFADSGFEVVDLNDVGVREVRGEDTVETGTRFEENALAKARYFHELTRIPTIADDSGLAVDALGGGPGVYSKRWSGRADLSGQALDDANNAL